ncbi:MAG: DNA-protecting protein DprA, partial [Gemmatimonadetes bacterium]|nr:DNA-protecting protein DprA [Gemmatimonadota bacterium]
QGCLISEYEAGVRPSRFTFPTRNRLIAGLAKCLLVVEGRAKGGTSNTVWWMQSLEKPIFAVPGRIDELVAEGPNLLLHQGASVYLSPRDLLAEYKIAWTGAAPDGSATGMGAPGAEVARAELSGAEATVFDVITPQPVHVDRIAQCTQLDAGLLLAALSSLELQGLIRQLPGKHFALAS